MKTTMSVCSQKGFVAKLVSIVLCIAIVFTLSVGAFASSYHYGVFKMGTLTGYNRNTSSWITSSTSIAIGSLTGTYKWSVSQYKPGTAWQYITPQVRARYDSYGYTGNDGDFASDANIVSSSIALRTGNVAPDLVNGVAKFTSSKILLLSDDTAKVQVSFTSNLPIDVILIRPYSFANNGYVGTARALTKGTDYMVNGEYYVVNYVFPASTFGNFDSFFLEFTASSAMNASTGKVYWDEDFWEIKFNRTLFPFWSKSNLSGNSSGSTNPSGNITNITYNYMANLDGIYNLLTILCDWQNLQFEGEMAQLEELQEATQLLNQCWSMLMILDSDLGIISADVADIMSAMYYSPGVTWNQHIYLRLQGINNDILSISTKLSNQMIELQSFHADNSAENEEIIDKLEDLERELKKINGKLDDIYDWLEELDLENNSDTKTFIQAVFGWIKNLLVVIVGIFATVISVPTLSVITDYNDDANEAIFPRG